jgi:uncharacterized protein YkwD
MIKKLFIVSLLITLMVSSCTAQATATQPAVPTSTEPPQAATATEATVAEMLIPTETQVQATEPPAVTATTEPPRPTNEPNCTNSASFVADVTIPDNSDIGAGAPFTKTWRISNTGTCIWASDYTLSHYSDERMNAPASVPLPLTYPGQTADVSVTLTAPNSLGKHQGNFVIKNAAGLIMKVNEDSRLWVIINSVSNTTAATAVSADTGLVSSTCAFSSETVNITDTLNAINAYRAKNSLPAYNNNSSLAKAAQSHANDMACNSLFTHTGSNGSTLQSRVSASGYTFSFVGENVYGSNPALTGQAVVNWWINDATDLRHNLNLVSDTYVDVGIGYSFYNNYGYYVVVFGTP